MNTIEKQATIPLESGQLNTGSSGLIFMPESPLPSAQPKPLGKVGRIFDTHLSGYFDTEQTGLQTASITFAKGVTFNGLQGYMHARVAGVLPTVDQAEKITIASGVCLFGGAALQCYGLSGEQTELSRPGVTADDSLPIVAHVEKASEQIYMPETIARLGKTIATIAEFASLSGKTAQAYIHLPGPEYKIKAEMAHADGKITAQALYGYYDLVDAEVATAKAGFQEIFASHDVQDIAFGSPLDPVVDGIEPGSLSVGSFKDTIFEAAITNVGDIEQAEHLSEVTAYTASVQPGSLPIFIDNHAQEKILKSAKKQPGFNGIALYPLPACASKQANNLLYHEGATQAEIAKAVAPWK